jgi:hypothetical protein
MAPTQSTAAGNAAVNSLLLLDGDRLPKQAGGRGTESYGRDRDRSPAWPLLFDAGN